MIRYLVSALIAALTLFATLLGLSKAIGPGSPGELLIVGQLELLASRIDGASEQPERVPRPPERPQREPSAP